MYEVGDYIVHPGQGVCKVDEIVDGPNESYMLMPVGGRHPMRISYPVSGEGRLRPILSQNEAEKIIDEYPSMSVEDFSCKSNALEEQHFKDEMRHGTCRDSVRIVKTFRVRIDQMRARNKKPPVAYERILKQASQRSLEELSVALGVSVEDVQQLFKAQEGERPEDN